MARILVVDDSASMRQVMTTCLPGLGHTVVVAPDGETALEMAETHAVDLVLLDFEMPGMNGLSLCEALKRDRARRHLPVLMMTGRPTRELVARARQAGALAVLSKPFTWYELLELFSRHLPAGV